MPSSANTVRSPVLVAGATGQQGGAVARCLLAAEIPVRALTRNPAKPAARALAARGAEVVAGDLNDAESLRRALDGAGAVFCVTQFYEAGYDGEVAQGKLMADLAAEARIGHFVFSSVGSADQNTGIPHFDSKYQVERHLAADSVPFTVLRPVFLMENWELNRAAINGGSLATPLSPDRPLQQVCAEDIGAFTLLALREPRRWAGQFVDLAGDELSMIETAQLFTRVTQHPVAVRQVSWDDYREQQGDEMYVMNRWFETTGYHADLSWLHQVNPQMVTLEDYLCRHHWQPRLPGPPPTKGTAMPNAVVMTGYGPPEVLKWADVPLPEPDEGQIRFKVSAAGISPTDLELRAGHLKDIPLPRDPVLGFEAAGTVDAVGPGVTGTSTGDAVAALLFGLGGYAEYAVASIWTSKPGPVSWIDAAALPSSAEAAAGVLRQLGVKRGETLLLIGGGGSVGIIATQLAVAQGVKVISAVGEHDERLARELGATPVRYGPGLAERVRALGPVDAVFDAAGTGVLADAIAVAGGPARVITLSDPAAAEFGVTLSQPTPDRAPGALDETIALLANGRLRLRAHKTMPMQQAAEAHRQLETGNAHERIILTLN